MIVLYT